MSEQLSRRDFIKLASAGVAALSVSGATKFKDVVGGVDFEIAKTLLSEKSLSLLPEIENFRNSLKLDKYPLELVPGIIQNVNWNDEPPKFEINLPENSRQYSDVINQITDLAFGKNKSRLIKGVKFDTKYPDRLIFDVINRQGIIGANINQPISQFIDTMAHEVVGHPSDPAEFYHFTKSLYPPDMLVSIEHGKWRALSQAFLIEGQFFNHPGDAMLPLVAKKLGKIVGEYLTKEQIFLPIFKGFGEKLAESVVHDIARDFGKSASELKYNKAVCIKLGKRLVESYLKGEVDFSGHLKTSYEEEMEDALREIFAEMVRIAIIHNKYEYLGNNTEIHDGVEEVLQSINTEPINLGEIKKSLYSSIGYDEVDLPSVKTSNIIEDQYYATVKNLSEPRPPKNTIEELVNQNSTPEEKFVALQRYIVQRYPSLAALISQKFNISFDPEMNLWDIEKIEWAVDANFTNNLINKSLDPKSDPEIKKRVKILEDFINSPAF